MLFPPPLLCEFSVLSICIIRNNHKVSSIHIKKKRMKRLKPRLGINSAPFPLLDIDFLRFLYCVAA